MQGTASTKIWSLVLGIRILAKTGPALRRTPGQGGLGALLDLGPERNMGFSHMDRLPGLHPLPASQAGRYPAGDDKTGSLFSFFKPGCM